MSPLTKLAIALAVLLLVGVPVAVSVGARLQQRARDALTDSLLAVPASWPDAGAGPSLEGLPAPVARYLAWAMPGHPIASVRLSQSGVLRSDARSDRWMTFEAEHVVSPPARGFLWSARVPVAPLIHLRVRDALLEGRGSGHVSLLSAFPIGSDSGTMEMDSGSLHRYLAEAVWYPTALLPGDDLRWSPIDDSTALATLSSGEVEVSLEFRFGPDGEVVGIYTPGRWGSFDGGYAQLPWEGHFARYELHQGVRLPMEGEVGWYVDGSWQAVWKGTVEAVHYRFSEDDQPR